MNETTKIPLLRAMGQIFETSENSQLSESIWTSMHDDLQVTADYFKVGRIQAFLIAHIFVMHYNQSPATIQRITRHLNCNPMRLLEYSAELGDLVVRGIILRSAGRRREVSSLSNDELYLSPKIEKAVLENSPMPEPDTPRVDCFVTFLERVADMEEALSDGEITTGIFNERLADLLKSNSHFSIVQQMNRSKIEQLDAFVFFKLAWEVLNGLESLEVESAIRDVLKKRAGKRVRYLQAFLKETNVLQTQDWVSLRQSRFLNEAEIELTDTGRKMLSRMGLHLEKKQEKSKKFLDPGSFAAKSLYFNPREAEELQMLQSMLMETNFKKLQSRLKKKNLPQGLTALFFGYPGTGKTESVLQMARKSGREVYKVDISQTKSMWFGESEKVIKRVFTDYRTYASQCKRMPILLFNEADAIISKRKDSSSSNVAQTENAIQNIILEELENFEGIFLATTNLVSNMDKAFDRRFLFKVEFDKPGTEVKARIWQNKLPMLSAAQCEALAEEFDFTGGQIDNIVRKCETHDVLHGVKAAMDTIVRYCRSESLQQTAMAAIGFKNSAQKAEQKKEEIACKNREIKASTKILRLPH